MTCYHKVKLYQFFDILISFFFYIFFTFYSRWGTCSRQTCSRQTCSRQTKKRLKIVNYWIIVLDICANYQSKLLYDVTCMNKISITEVFSFTPTYSTLRLNFSLYIRRFNHKFSRRKTLCRCFDRVQ